jgi:predicted tellurium resistance membrane protein TerC
MRNVGGGAVFCGTNLILIGFTMVAEGLEFNISKRYINFAMSFSIFVEILNMKVREKVMKPIALKKAMR